MQSAHRHDEEVRRGERRLGRLEVSLCEMRWQSGTWMRFELGRFSRGLGRVTFLAGHARRRPEECSATESQLQG